MYTIEAMDGQDIIGIQWNLHQVSSYTVKLTPIFYFSSQ